MRSFVFVMKGSEIRATWNQHNQQRISSVRLCQKVKVQLHNPAIRKSMMVSFFAPISMNVI